MCEGVSHCPNTGLKIEEAPCNIIRNFGIPITDIEEQTSKEVGDIIRGGPELAKKFFQTGWTNR